MFEFISANPKNINTFFIILFIVGILMAIYAYSKSKQNKKEPLGFKLLIILFIAIILIIFLFFAINLIFGGING